MKKHLLLLFAALLPLVASAEKVKIGGIWYNLVSKAKQAEVTYKGDSYVSYKEYSGDITIPATVTYDGVAYSVTSIGNYAFGGCSSLTSITIPEGVTSIGYGAFEVCSSLTSITIPEGVTSIGGSAFDGCSGFTAVYISSIEAWCKITFENYDSNPLYYAHNLYLNGELVTKLVIPEGVTSIGGDAFRGCESLTAITIPKGVTSIGNNAFYDCGSLTTITIPEGVTSIGYGAFYNCRSLTAITIPEGVTSIEALAFYGCTSLTAFTIPEGVTSIGYNAFSGCTSLTTINIPENSQLTNIGMSAFYNCRSLTAITIPEGVTSIGESAFSGCRSLTAITLPEGVTSIGYQTFLGCSSLTAITLPEGVGWIGNSAFSGCTSLTAIMLPKSVKSIGREAFANCSELTDVYCYAETVPSTEADAFDGSYIEYATLHVPASAMNEYKNAAPWSSFGKVETLEITVDEITLSQSAAELIEGESLQLTATVSPDDAEDKSISWSSNNPSIATVDNMGKVTAIAPGTATITVTANDGSGVNAQCEVTVNELILGKCATPTISYTDGKVVLTCETEGAEVMTNIEKGDDETHKALEFDLIPTYTITAYATKEHYENSDTVALTICWVPCGENHEGGTTDVLTIPAKPVLIQCQGGVITLSGLAEDTEVAVYTAIGAEVATGTATSGTATLTTTLTAGTIAIVKIGDYSIKVAIK